MSKLVRFTITMKDLTTFDMEMPESEAFAFIRETIREGYLDEAHACFYPFHSILKVGLCEPCAPECLRTRFSPN